MGRPVRCNCGCNYVAGRDDVEPPASPAAVPMAPMASPVPVAQPVGSNTPKIATGGARTSVGARSRQKTGGYLVVTAVAGCCCLVAAFVLIAILRDTVDGKARDRQQANAQPVASTPGRITEPPAKTPAVSASRTVQRQLQRGRDYGRELVGIAVREFGGVEYPVPAVRVENVDLVPFEIAALPEDRVVELVKAGDWARLVYMILGLEVPTVEEVLGPAANDLELKPESVERYALYLGLEKQGAPAEVVDRTVEALADRPYTLVLRIDGPPLHHVSYLDQSGTRRILEADPVTLRQEELRIPWHRANGDQLFLNFDMPESAIQPSDSRRPGSAEPAFRPMARTLDEILAGGGSATGQDEPALAVDCKTLFADCFQPKVVMGQSLGTRSLPEYKIVVTGKGEKYQQLINEQDWDALAKLAVRRPAAELNELSWQQVKHEVSQSSYNLVFDAHFGEAKAYCLKTCLLNEPSIGWNKSCYDGGSFVVNLERTSLSAVPKQIDLKKRGTQTLLTWQDSLGTIYLSDQTIGPEHQRSWNEKIAVCAKKLRMYRLGYLERNQFDQELQMLYRELHEEHRALLKL